MSKNTYSNVFDQNFVDATNTMAEFMYDMENIPSVPAFAEFGDPSALRDAVPSQVTVG
jgi:NitT/TauT family transport system substrate-binding protein